MVLGQSGVGKTGELCDQLPEKGTQTEGTLPFSHGGAFYYPTLHWRV